MSDETLDPASAELENQLRRLETMADPASRSLATDVIASVLQFHTAALERMLDLVADTESADKLLVGFDADPLIRSVLLIHDLHPDSLHARVSRAIADLEPLLEKRGATIELIAAEGGLVRARISGGESAGRVAAAVEQAIRSAAPEAVQVIIEEPDALREAGFVPLDAIQSMLPAASVGGTQK